MKPRMRETLVSLRASGFMCRRGCTLHASCSTSHAISAMRGALAMLSQPATLPSDIATARVWLRDALSDLDTPVLPERTATDSE